jgi:hypothetical protein
MWLHVVRSKWTELKEEHFISVITPLVANCSKPISFLVVPSSLKRKLVLSGLYCVISQEIELFLRKPVLGSILGFLDRNPYFFFQVAPQLYSRGWVDPVSDPLLLRKSGSAGNRTRTSGYVARNSWLLDHRDGAVEQRNQYSLFGMETLVWLVAIML